MIDFHDCMIDPRQTVASRGGSCRHPPCNIALATWKSPLPGHTTRCYGSPTHYHRVRRYVPIRSIASVPLYRHLLV